MFLLFSLLIPLIFIGCPLGLIFQILNKNKTKFDKIILTLNAIGLIILVLIIYIAITKKPIDYSEKNVRAQISREYPTLNDEYQPVLDYLAKYKKENGVYPEQIDKKILPKSKIFKEFEYKTNDDGKGYDLKVSPKKELIDYYFNDENDNGYNQYKGNGFDGNISGCMHYEIDSKWHAIKWF